MSVIVKDESDGVLRVYTKGAPERVLKLCKPETVPGDAQDVINRLSRGGYRILAFASK